MAVLLDNHWLETALVSISKKGGSEIEFAASSDEITFSGGERDMDMKTLLNGGNMRRFTPMTTFEISMKIFAAEVDIVHEWFYGGTDAVQPLSVTNALTRFEFRVSMMWTDSAAATATGLVDGSKDGIRMYAINGLMTKCEPFWTDGELGFDVTFKFAPYTTAAVGTLTWESTDGTADMTALAAYS